MALVTGVKMSALPVPPLPLLSVGGWLAYGATVRDRGAGSEAGWAGRSCSVISLRWRSGKAGVVSQAGTFATTPEGVREFAAGLGPADEGALEATENTWAIATLLARHAGRWWCRTRPRPGRSPRRGSRPTRSMRRSWR